MSRIPRKMKKRDKKMLAIMNKLHKYLIDSMLTGKEHYERMMDVIAKPEA